MNEYEDYTDREIIIHDDIPIELIDCIIVKNDKLKKEVEILMDRFKIPVFLDTRELCYTNIVLDYPEESEDVNDYIKGFTSFNPYNLSNINKEDDLKENEYLWNKRLINCGINDQYSPEKSKELIKKIEDRMQALYFENASRIYVGDDNLPPFKYTPEYYKKYE